MFKNDNRWQIVILAIAFILVFLIGVQYGKYTVLSTPPDIQITENSQEEVNNDFQNKIKVHVVGAVSSSGVYELKAGSRVNDALKMAKPLPEADLDRLNLAAPLKDGQQIKVFYRVEDKIHSQEIKEESGKININYSSAKRLQELPGIGPALAERIIQYRTQNGYFNSIDELKNVSGIGDKKFNAIKDLITI